MYLICHIFNILKISWSSRLLTTAGITLCREIRLGKDNPQKQREAAIELSIKVVDTEIRLQETLLHELCHAATWIIDGVRKPPHGAEFKVKNL